tara:strand:+ start:37 stop:294 length:258 start_codon:yes stop_codon:yes gene_type:complete
MSSNTDFTGNQPAGVRTWIVTPTADQTVFTIMYTANRLFVFLNGIKLISGVDYTATNGTSVTLTTGVAVTDRVEFNCFDLWDADA